MSLDRRYYQQIGSRLQGALDDGITEYDAERYPDLVIDIVKDIGISGGYTPEEYRKIQNAISGGCTPGTCNDEAIQFYKDVEKAFPYLDSDISSYVRERNSGNAKTWTPYTLGSIAIQEAARTVDYVEKVTEQPKDGESIQLSGGKTTSQISTLYSRAGLLVALIAIPAVVVGLYLYYNWKDWRKSLWTAAGLFALVALLGGYAVYYMMLRAYEVVV